MLPLSLVIIRVHSDHLMSACGRQAATDPHTKLVDLGCEPACRLLFATPTITIYYY